MKKLKNPFLLIGFQGNKYFCNREEELAKLHEHFENERNVVLYSWRRTGKTALLKNFMSRLEKTKKADTLYIDLSGTRDITSAIKQITSAVYQRFGTTSTGIATSFQKLLGMVGAELSFDAVSGVPKLSFGLRETGLPEKSLESIGKFLVNRSKQMLIVLDEFQQVINYSDKNGEAVFRSWMQSFPHIRFVFSGSHRNMMTSMFAKKNRPFYRSAQLLQLNPIELRDYEKFITKHFTENGKTIEPETIKAIYTWSRKQTYCVQLVCNKLYGMHDNVKPKHPEQVYDEILKQEAPVFSDYTNLLTATQWKVMLAIALEEPLENPLSKEFINKHHLGAASSVSTALKMLQNNELVIKEDQRFYIHDVLLARWIQAL